MRYSTDYNIEQITEILKNNSLPLTYSNSFIGDTFLTKFKKDKAYLLKTGTVFYSSNGQLPLIIKFIKRNDHAILKCRFGFTWPMIVTLGSFLCLAWIIVSFVCFLDSNISLYFKLFVAIMLSLWSFLAVMQFHFYNITFYRKRRRAALSFLNEYLCAKRY